ncbi:D-alanyl-D-alanine carboxypeptidase/D-alanyl-D-alanine endopeptidase [Lysinibacillus sp. 54212]|uniref:D-alanyl-D-alanine carboxypeptidase/D-alanyl-D-alanine endopeptidase n=1 Tax=Lysinibacillus sp. 54212 TaxID=3119829 RepID=UPI002FC9A690
MNVKLKISIWIFVLVLFATTLPAYASSTVNLDSEVTKKITSSSVSVSLRKASDGKLVYSFNGDIKRKPASNLKLLTGAASLQVLGESYRYKTELYIDGLLFHSSLYGNVYVKGSGDPTLQYSDLEMFAQILKGYGIEKIYGDIYGDDTYFSGEELTPGIKKIDESDYFAARTSALVLSPTEEFDAATIVVEVSPTEIGQNGSYKVIPNISGMSITNLTKTVKGNEENTIEVKRRFRSNEIILSGNIPMHDISKKWVTVHDPTINTLHAMKAALSEQGILINKDSIVTRKKVPKNATRIYTKRSQTLKEMMPVFMKLSNNSMADIFVKTLGAEVYGVGETNTGLKVLREYGEQIRINTTDWTFEDGSGMSHRNRVTANSLTSLLFKVQGASSYETFFHSLPVGGQKERLIGGTLRNRFKDSTLLNRVVAKTGNIEGVYTLSGYITTMENNHYIFSIMTENGTREAIKEIDDIVWHIIKKY